MNVCEKYRYHLIDLKLSYMDPVTWNPMDGYILFLVLNNFYLEDEAYKNRVCVCVYKQN
jgi:hypothetical protein